MKISLSGLSTKNLATLAQRTINSSKTGNYTIVANHPLLLALETLYATYDDVYGKLTYSGKGKEVAAADAVRDVAFRNMKAFLNGYRKLPSAPNQKDAEDLYRIFKTHGLQIDRMSYSAQTAQMKKLIEELMRSENATKINALSLGTAFTELNDAQEDFEDLFADQAEANADLRQMQSATGIRHQLEKALRAYLGLLTAMKDVEEWSKLYADVKEVVKAAKNSSQEPENKDDGKPDVPQ